MKVRVCPLCDQPMKKMHHCDNCNSFIWKPQYIDIHYNTDTVQGSDCSFGAEPHDYDYCEDGSVTMMPSRKRRTGMNRKHMRTGQMVKEELRPEQKRSQFWQWLFQSYR